MKKVGGNDCVSHSSFIFQTYKDKSLGGSRTLAGDDASSDAEALAAGNVAKFAGAADAHGIEPFASVGHRMRSHSHSCAVEVGDQTFFMVHGLERRRRIGFGERFQQ